MPFSRGDVVLVLFPDSNLRTAKRRPALVVQRDGLTSDLPQTIIARITSNLSRAEHPSRVPVRRATAEGQRSGLLSDSIIMTDNLATVLEPEIDRAIGSWADMAVVEVALRDTLSVRPASFRRIDSCNVTSAFPSFF